MKRISVPLTPISCASCKDYCGNSTVVNTFGSTHLKGHGFVESFRQTGRDDRQPCRKAGPPNTSLAPQARAQAALFAAGARFPNPESPIPNPANIGRRALQLTTLLLTASVCLAAQQTLTLADAERIAIQNHPVIHEAELNALASQQATVVQKSAYYPTAVASLTGADAMTDSRIAAGGLNNPIIYSRTAGGVMASQLITDFGRTSNLVKSSSLNAQARTEDTETARESVKLAVARGYFGVLRARAVLNVAQQTMQARQTVADQISALAQNKLRSGLDVSFAQVNLAQAKLLLAQSQNDLDASYAQLAEAMGSPTPTAYALVEEPQPSAPPSQVAPLITYALQHRPEVLSARLQTESARHFARAERDLSLPTVSAVAGTGVASWTAPAAIAPHYGALGLNINIPVFNGFQFSARHHEAELQQRAQQQRERNLEIGISQDVRVAWLQAQTDYQRIGLTEQLSKQAALALDLAQARYKLGLSSIVELSQAQLASTEAQLQETTAKYDYQIQNFALQYQLGNIH